MIRNIRNKEGADGKVLVFTTTKRTANFLANQFTSRGLIAMALHGDKTQSQRDYIIDGILYLIYLTFIEVHGLWSKLRDDKLKSV